VKHIQVCRISGLDNLYIRTVAVMFLLALLSVSVVTQKALI